MSTTTASVEPQETEVTRLVDLYVTSIIAHIREVAARRHEMTAKDTHRLDNIEIEVMDLLGVLNKREGRESKGAVNPADGSSACALSSACILGYGHTGACVVDPQDLAPACDDFGAPATVAPDYD